MFIVKESVGPSFLTLFLQRLRNATKVSFFLISLMFSGSAKGTLTTFCGALENDLKKFRTQMPFRCFHNILYTLKCSDKKTDLYKIM